MIRTAITVLLLFMVTVSESLALERPEIEFKIFQFPPHMIPRIDGNPDDWDMVPDDYSIGTEQFKDMRQDAAMDRNDLDVTVKVGWVKGMNRIYFLYEADDDFWDFANPGLHNDIFELVVDGDLSGGPLIPQLRKDRKVDPWEGYLFHGVHAQNYHIFTPAEGKAWTMVWGCQPWISRFPWSNAVYSYDFRHGESGNLILEFWITPFDYAPYGGPGRSVVSTLEVNRIIGLCWSILDWDGEPVNGKSEAFWSLSHKFTMYGNASDLCAFRLMPLDERFHEPIEAAWSFEIIDMDRRLVAFHDQSYGDITSWLWDFGDGTTSTEQYPVHVYEKPGLHYIVTLEVRGPAGENRLSKVWDVAVK